ncbi:MAG: sigma-70 family RNA polymerase sigma factor [Myxococcales bacterium]|nr:sigma-70 family RNA polymerase sigma factor [Myxococcales bacterium]
MGEDDDLGLLDRWRAGEVAAGKQLFERYFDRLFRFFCNKVGPDVDDLVQETLLECVRSRDNFRADSSFRTFLFAIARHRLLKHRERFARAGSPDELEEQRLAALDAGPATLLCEHAEQRALLRALRRIPLELQVLLELYYWEDLTSAELAVILEIPHGTVRSRLRRGKQEVREVLATLRDSGELLQTTDDDFDRWLRSMRARAPRA